MMDFGLFLLFAAINDAELEEQERMRRQEEERDAYDDFIASLDMKD